MKKHRIHDAGGAYVLHLHVRKKAALRAGKLGEIVLPRGRYLYVGSARRSIEARAARHRRLDETKTGRLRWHIDYLLVHPDIDLVRVDSHYGRQECAVSKRIQAMPDATIPVPRFGASDCRSGCGAHLFRIKDLVKRKPVLRRL